MKISFIKNHIWILVSILIIYSCNPRRNVPQNLPIYGNKVSDSIIYGFINYLIDHPNLNVNIKAKIINDEKLKMPFPFALKNDSIELTKMPFLSANDIKYIFSQKKQFQAFIINPNKVNNKRLITNDSIFEKNNEYSTISCPLFNIDKTIAIIRTSYSDCSSCQVGGVYIFQKQDSKWVLIKKIQGWVI
jgi:hypothetical protein